MDYRTAIDEQFFAIKDGGYYIAIDGFSGGYPVKTDIEHCKQFPSKQKAEEYMDIFVRNGSTTYLKNPKIVECEYILREL